MMKIRFDSLKHIANEFEANERRIVKNMNERSDLNHKSPAKKLKLKAADDDKLSNYLKIHENQSRYHSSADRSVEEMAKRLKHAEHDIIKRNYDLLMSDSGEDPNQSKVKMNKKTEWERRLTRKYSDRLFKEYALCQFSPDRKQIGIRWRTDREVRSGKGETICGNVQCNFQPNISENEDSKLKEYETIFSYKSSTDGVKKECLVKLSLCFKCLQTVTDIYACQKRRDDSADLSFSGEITTEVEKLEQASVVEHENIWQKDVVKSNGESTSAEYDDFLSKMLTKQ